MIIDTAIGVVVGGIILFILWHFRYDIGCSVALMGRIFMWSFFIVGMLWIGYKIFDSWGPYWIRGELPPRMTMEESLNDKLTDISAVISWIMD